jgi:hypothetical protein
MADYPFASVAEPDRSRKEPKLWPELEPAPAPVRTDIVFNSNEIDYQSPDPTKIYKLERIHDLNNNAKLRSFKLLGVFFDEHLTFTKQISHISAKLISANFYLRRVANFVSVKTLRTLYFSLFHPHLLYCSIILSCASSTALNKISQLQKNAI